MTHRPDADDLDEVLARSVPPPADLGGRVLGRLAVARRAGRLGLALAAYAACLLALAVLATLAGRQAASAGAVELSSLGVQDRSLVQAYPGEYGRALVGAVPWALVAALALDVAALVGLTQYLLRATEPRPFSVEVPR